MAWSLASSDALVKDGPRRFNDTIRSLWSDLNEELLRKSDRYSCFLPEGAALKVFRTERGAERVKDLYRLSTLELERQRNSNIIDSASVEASSSSQPTDQLLRRLRGSSRVLINGQKRFRQVIRRHRKFEDEPVQTNLAADLPNRSVHPDASASKGSVADPTPEAFWRSVVGEDGDGLQQGDTRALLLAALILSDVEFDSQALQNFVRGILEHDERFCDHKLPLKTYAHVGELFGNDEDMNAKIYQRQYIVWVPRIVKDLQLNDDPGLVRLPYLKEKELENLGSHGTLYEVKIAPGHFDGKCNLVRKDIKRDESLEVVIGRQLERNGRMSRHITPTLATITFPYKVSILMERAECNLEQFMNAHHRFSRTRSFQAKLDLFRKILGPGDGLDVLHTLIRDWKTGRAIVVPHLDFNPRNVLIFKEEDGEEISPACELGKESLRFQDSKATNAVACRQRALRPSGLPRR